MIAFPSSATVWIAGGVTDMRRGMNTLALQVQEGLGRDPHAGEIFCFRGRKGNLVKLLWHDGVCGALIVSVGMPKGGWVHFEGGKGLTRIKHPCLHLGEGLRGRREKDTPDMFSALQ